MSSRLAIAFVMSLSLVSSAHAAAPTLFEHGVVFTGRSLVPDATWFVVRGGRVADVGDGPVPDRWKDAARVDLGGRFVTPGFVDAHVHFVDGGLSLLEADASECRSEAEVADVIRRAAAAPLSGDDGWVVVRNLGLDALGGDSPTHARMAALTALAGRHPLLVLLKGGHHAYASPRALERLDIDADTPDPAAGTIVRDARGQPSGLLVDDAAWSAMRAVAGLLGPELVARAILSAERLALGYGITSIGDNTFDPSHMAQYLRLSDAHLFHLRVSSRSFGLEPATRLTMRSQGALPFGKQNPRIRYFGDKYFLDGALSQAGARPGESAPPVAPPRYSVGELRDFMLFAGPFGTAFHTQSREGAERLARARSGIVSRRAGALPDIIDHCGRCGGGGLPERIRKSGLRVTLLPGQLHELPALMASLPPEQHDSLLAFRELVAAGLEPALTSDWPYGAETIYPDVPDGLRRIGLAPLAGVAVAVSGKAPDGQPIAGLESRTIGVGEALLGITAWGARAIGRDDVGMLAPGKLADFVVLPSSPFDLDPVALYRMDPDEVWVGGKRVAGKSIGGDVAAPMPDLSRFASRPSGNAISPIIGSDPVTGFLIGAAWFFYPYQRQGLRGSVQLYTAPEQLRARLDAEVVAMHAWGDVSPRVFLRADSLKDRFYGRGMDTDPDVAVTTEPLRLDLSLGASAPIAPHLELGVSGLFTLLDEGARDRIAARGESADRIDGANAGLRLELAHDDRDNAFATRTGGRRVLWTEGFALQAGAASYRQRAGLTLTQFIPLYAPDVVLALRADVAISGGARAYATDFALGGGDVLRGYYSNRFRGDAYAAGAVELRLPLFWALSAALFGEVGHVWAEGSSGGPALATSGGIGLRLGLPPDRLVRLRFDLAFAPDQWGFFFKFNEAF